ncbi:hypothetical protein Tco_1271737, partial [Tanacetum coccineum]
GMGTCQTEIATTCTGVDRVRRHMDALNIGITFVEHATTRVEDDVLALQARAETAEARQL